MDVGSFLHYSFIEYAVQKVYGRRRFCCTGGCFTFCPFIIKGFVFRSAIQSCKKDFEFFFFNLFETDSLFSIIKTLDSLYQLLFRGFNITYYYFVFSFFKNS